MVRHRIFDSYTDYTEIKETFYNLFLRSAQYSKKNVNLTRENKFYVCINIIFEQKES